MPGPDGAPVCPTPPSQRWTRAEHAHPRAKGVEKNIAHRVWVPDLGHSSHWTTQTGRRASERVPVGTRSWTVTCLPVTPEKPGDGAGGQVRGAKCRLGSWRQLSQSRRQDLGHVGQLLRALFPSVTEGALALDGRGGQVPSSPQRPLPLLLQPRPADQRDFSQVLGAEGGGQEWGLTLGGCGFKPWLPQDPAPSGACDRR